MDSILASGWEQVESPSITRPFAAAARARLMVFDYVFGRKDHRESDPPLWIGDGTRRRLLVDALMWLPPTSEDAAGEYTHHGLVLPEDTSWLIERMTGAASPEQRRRWVNITARIGWASRESFEVQDAIARAIDDGAEDLRAAYLDRIDLDSALAAQLRQRENEARQHHEEMERIRARRRNGPDPGKQITDCIQRFDDGELGAGWQLFHWIMVDPESRAKSYREIVAAPGWKHADATTRARILDVARSCLAGANDRSEEWLGKSRFFPESALAAYHYLNLLDTVNPTWVSERPMTFWATWAGVIVRFFWTNGVSPSRNWVTLAYGAAPHRVLAVLKALLDSHRDDGQPDAIQCVTHCWDDRLGRFVLDYAQQPDLKPRFFGQLMDHILRERVDGGVAYALSALAGPVLTEEHGRPRALEAARALLMHALEAGWERIWHVIRKEPGFGREIFLQTADHMLFNDAQSWGRGLSVAETTELYLWLAAQFPRREEPHRPPGEVFTLTPRDIIAELRNSLMNNLASQGTLEAVSAVERINRELPGQIWKGELFRVREAAAQNTWEPLRPCEIIKLGRDAATGSRPVLPPTFALTGMPTRDHIDTLHRPSIAATSAPHTDVLLVTVTKIETEAVLAAAAAPSPPAAHIEGRVYFDLGDINGARVRLTRSEMGAGGLGGAQQAITKAIAALSPSAVVMVGIAFGIAEGKQSIGDILVTEQLHLYDRARVGTHDGKANIVPRGDKSHASPNLINLYKSADMTWKGATVRFGAILSGDKLVDNIDYRDQLRGLEPEAIGGEMEGAGLYVACYEAKVDWILIKAICDWADGNKGHDKDARQALAAKNAAEFALHALRFVKVEWKRG